MDLYKGISTMTEAEIELWDIPVKDGYVEGQLIKTGNKHLDIIMGTPKLIDNDLRIQFDWWSPVDSKTVVPINKGGNKCKPN